MFKHILLLVILATLCIQITACNKTADCSFNGFCDDNECHCFNNYITHESVLPCNYKQASRTTAFLLEFFLGGVGAGWFYLGRLDFALSQLLLFIIPSCAALCFAFVFFQDKHDTQGESISAAALCLRCIFLLASIGLWLHGVIVIGTGQASDSNGVFVGDW